jgi:PAS domain S-box-containing protein
LSTSQQDKAERPKMSEENTSAQELGAFTEFCQRILDCHDEDKILSEVIKFLARIVEVQACTIYDCVPNSDEMIVKAVWSKPSVSSILPEVSIVNLDENDPLRQALETKTLVFLNLEEQEGHLPNRYLRTAEAGSYSLILAPIELGGDIQGAAELVILANEREIGSSEVTSLRAALTQATAAIDRARRFRASSQEERFFTRLNRTALAMRQTRDLPELMALICRECSELFEVDGVYIWQKQEEELIGIAACGYEEQNFIGSYALISEDVFASVVAKQGRPQYCNDYQQQTSYSKHFPPAASIASVLGVPLTLNDDIDGVLVMVDTESTDRFSSDDIDRVSIFSAHAAAAVQNDRHLLDLKELVDQLEITASEQSQAIQQEQKRVQYLFQLTTELSETLDQDRLIGRALELVSDVVGASQSAILVVDPRSGELVYPSAYEALGLRPLSGALDDEGIHFEIARRVVESCKSVIVEPSSGEDEELCLPEGLGLNSAMGTPLKARDEVAGVLLLFHEEPNAFSSDQVVLVEAAAYQVGTGISNAQLFHLIRDQAGRLGQLLRQESVSAARSQAILESIADGVVVADATGNITLANSAARDFLGLSNDQLIGKRVSDHANLFALFGDRWIDTAKEWALGANANRRSSFLAHTLELDDKYVGVQLSPVFANEQYFGTVSVFRDVTHAVETDRAKNEFVSTVSHELRTPMTSIKGYADLMLMGVAGGMTEEQQHYLSVIKGNADRVTSLVNDLLDVARMESGKTELELQETNVAGIITIAVNDHLRGLIENGDKTIDTRVDLEPSLPVVLADPERLLQVITNLLDNAYNYTPSGGVISIDAEVIEGYVQVAVSDTGIGIKEENLSHIFERYYRVDDSQVQGVAGTGLGLSIVRSLVLLHGGTIEVESEVDKGSSFIIRLPIAHQSEDS